MKIEIKALDTLTFGVGKPSVWGENIFGAGMFPPYPSVVRGAVRALWLYEHGTFEQADTANDPTRDYQVTEYALMLNGVPHFPVPADYLRNDEDNTLIACQIEDNDNLSSLTTPKQLRAHSTAKLTTPDRRYISVDSLQDYLEGKTIEKSEDLADYTEDESKIGVFIERGRKTGKKGMLYRSPMTRPAKIINNNTHNQASLAVNISGADDITGLIRFGGDNKVAQFSRYSGSISPAGTISDDGCFKVYIATPAIFENGFEPDLPVAAQLLTAAVCGYDSIGGFDMKKKQPKPMLRAVKPSSVYYYKLNDNSAENRNKVLQLHGTNISNFGEFTRPDGFGICYIGKF